MEMLNQQHAEEFQGAAVSHSRLWKCAACQGVFGFAVPSPQPHSCGLCGNTQFQPVKS